MKKSVPGTIRIKKDLEAYKKIRGGWRKISKKKFLNVVRIIDLFKINNNFSELIDKKNPDFLKGQLSPEGKTQGARINILPDGRKLDGAYSLFAKNLTIHDQKSNSHWDVIYQNPNGNFAYHYTLRKKKRFTNKKYKEVRKFEEVFIKLQKNLLDALKNNKNVMALALYTLLRTHLRVGNEIYFKFNNHKGLATLKKSDVSIKGNIVNFDFLGKGGVPQKISKEFPGIYVKRLKKRLGKIKSNGFIFKNKRGKILSELDFKKAFKKYCGYGFYPHIIRSYFATKQAEDFLKNNKKPTKKEVKNFLKSIAEDLGHKKFSKKTKGWEDNYSIILGYYIEPRLVRKLRKFL